MPNPIHFRAVLEPGGPSFMPTQILVVPVAVLEALGGKATKRVVANICGHALRLGLLPLEGGGRYLMLNKDSCQVVGIALGQELEISIEADPNPDHVDLPDELAEALAAWPEAEIAFNNYKPAHRRAMAWRVAEAKQPETRIRRAVTLTERLARGQHPFRAD
ncbi:YdeI/OmpD-associated family protein [Hymenobacter sp. UYCo722]|uniref:YdeI/OmpD-associated family protein n=1 Tax=Hymenobacter sp. UYCo722 TaxID=3156335 RepID=UPI003390ADA3